MIAVCDTSVWIDYFNGMRTDETDMLDGLLLDGGVILLDLILLELLQGFKKESDYKTARRLLLALPIEQALNVESALMAADHYRLLRKKGITIRATADMVIATWCINRGTPLLYKDRDFDAIRTYLSLQNALMV